MSQCVRGLSEPVKASFVDQFKTLVQKGESVVDSTTEAIQTHLNYTKVNAESNVHALLRYTQGLIEPEIVKQIEGVRGKAEALEIAQQRLREAGSSEAFIKQQAQNAVNIHQMDTKLLAGRAHEIAIAEEVSGLANVVRAGGEDAAKAVEDMGNRVGAFAQLRQADNVIQTEGARIPASGRYPVSAGQIDPAKRLEDALKEVLRGGDTDTAERLANRLALADGDPRAIEKLLAPLNEYGKKGFDKALSLHNEYWINSILSGYKTITTNLLSNVVNSVMLPAERIIGGALTMDGAAVASGLRMYASMVGSLFDVFTLAGRSTKMGSTLGRAFDAFKNETPFLDAVMHGAEKAGPQKAWSSANVGLASTHPLGMLIDGLGQVIRLPSRILTASDEIFKQINYRAAAKELALQEAEKQGLLKAGNGKAVQDFVNNYVENSFGHVGQATNEAALEYAQRATFTSPLKDGTIAKSLSDTMQKHPGMRLLIPFVRTPTNVMRQFWQYTPGLNLLQKEFQELLSHPDPNIRKGALGRLMVGAGLTFAVGSMALAGKITGGGPQNAEQRQALMATGWRPYSVVFEGEDGKKEYVEYRRIDPLASLFGLTADFVEATHGMNDFDTSAVMTAMGMSIAKNVTSRTYLQGITEAANLLSDPDRNAKKWLITRLGTYVPNAVNQANSDPYMREVRDLLDGMRARIPGVSETLPPLRNYFGEVIPKPPGWAPWDDEGSDFKLSPFAYSQKVDSRVKDEIANLQVGVSKPPSKIAGIDLTMITKPGEKYDAYDRYQALVGEAKVKGVTIGQTLDKLVKSQWYQSQPAPSQPNDRTNPRVRAVMSVFADYRDAAQRQLLKEYPQIEQTKRGLDKARRAQHNPTIQKILSF